MTRPILLTLLAIALLAPLGNVFATTNEWAVVPATHGDGPAPAERIAVDVGRELQRQGRRVWPSQKATALFERKSSAEPGTLSDETIQRWLDHSRAGIRELAIGERASALQHLRSAVQLSRAALTPLNREEQRAQRVLDTCLYLVRALLEVGQPAEARKQAPECAFFTPGGTPQELMHPPAVLALYDEARREGAGRTGNLIVESESEGCTVRVNGMRLGRTPFETTGLGAGVHAVQVECSDGRPGRVHSARVDAGTTRLRIDTRVDRTVRTEPMLRLEYRAESAANLRQAAARSIARALPARWVILVSQPSADTIELDLVGDAGSHMGCARIEVGPLGVRSDTLTTAVRNVIAGKCRDASASTSPAHRAPGPQSLFIPAH